MSLIGLIEQLNSFDEKLNKVFSFQYSVLLKFDF